MQRIITKKRIQYTIVERHFIYKDMLTYMNLLNKITWNYGSTKCVTLCEALSFVTNGNSNIHDFVEIMELKPVTQYSFTTWFDIYREHKGDKMRTAILRKCIRKTRPKTK